MSPVMADVPNITIQAGSFRLLGQPATIQSRQPRIQTIRRSGKVPVDNHCGGYGRAAKRSFCSVGNLFTNSAAEGAGEIVVNARDVTLSSDGNLTFTGLAAKEPFIQTMGISSVRLHSLTLLVQRTAESITLMRPAR